MPAGDTGSRRAKGDILQQWREGRASATQRTTGDSFLPSCFVVCRVALFNRIRRMNVRVGSAGAIVSAFWPSLVLLLKGPHLLPAALIPRWQFASL